VKLYRTGSGILLEHGSRFFTAPGNDWDALLAQTDLCGYLESLNTDATPVSEPAAGQLLAPIGTQEVWAAGVTYYRSRDARMAESTQAGASDFYDRVYAAERPELFFKATAARVAAPGTAVRIRRDSRWSVPEPELTVVVNARGKVIGNDMSARDIEGENPLYLPQAKIYDRSCAIGPCVLIAPNPLPAATGIRIEITRQGRIEFSGATTLAQLSRKIEVLVEYLYRDNDFPAGVYLMTGTGIVPPDSFALAAGDRVRISIDAIGTLENVVVQGES
jgi:2-dehydro-3-deoxy-D-arabinonate dehydratase